MSTTDALFTALVLIVLLFVATTLVYERALDNQQLDIETVIAGHLPTVTFENHLRTYATPGWVAAGVHLSRPACTCNDSNDPLCQQYLYDLRRKTERHDFMV